MLRQTFHLVIFLAMYTSECDLDKHIHIPVSLSLLQSQILPLNIPRMFPHFSSASSVCQCLPTCIFSPCHFMPTCLLYLQTVPMLSPTTLFSFIRRLFWSGTPREIPGLHYLLNPVSQMIPSLSLHLLFPASQPFINVGYKSEHLFDVLLIHSARLYKVSCRIP